MVKVHDAHAEEPFPEGVANEGHRLMEKAVHV